MTVRAVSGRVNKTARLRLPASQRSRGYSIPSPVLGWNARDSLAAMREGEAIKLDNWFPEETKVRVRRGYTEHATGLGGAVESLMPWIGPTSSKLFGAANGDIFEVTNAGAVGAADLTSLTSDRWQHTMFGISSGNYLYIVNGADAPRHYNGTTWATPALSGSGLTVTDLIHVNVFKTRLFFIEKDSMSFWYLPVENIAGTLTEFNLAPRVSLGGHLVAMGSWTRDSGTGMDDLAAFVTSEGEVIVFQGNDPGDAAAWGHVGSYRIAPPIGRRCLAQIGAELVIVTEDGFSPLSRFLASERISMRAALSDKISDEVKQAVRDNKTRFGWQPVFHPSGNMILFNIPRATTNVQFVSNATTGAWCRFTGLDAECWAVHDDKLYFGGNGKVYQGDNGLNDDGGNIDADAITAFSYFGVYGQQKKFSMVRPNFVSDGDLDIGIAVSVDFGETSPEATPTFLITSGGVWDTADWDDAEWGGELVTHLEWLSIGDIGTAASLRVKARALNGEVRWNATDWLLEPAGFI